MRTNWSLGTKIRVLERKIVLLLECEIKEEMQNQLLTVIRLFSNFKFKTCKVVFMGTKGDAVIGNLQTVCDVVGTALLAECRN